MNVDITDNSRKRHNGTECILCMECVKACPKQAISMKGAVAVIDPAKCVNCGLCAQKCPAKAIVNERTTAKAV